MSIARKSKRHYRAIGRAARSVFEPLEDRLLLSTIYVDAASAGPTQDGTSWSSAYADLQAGLAAAQQGDRIDIAHGTYKPSSTTDRAATFQLKNGVALYGGYAGVGTANPDARDVAAYPTILSGDIGVAGDGTDNSYHVVTGNGTDSTAVLDGCTVTGGNADYVEIVPLIVVASNVDLSNGPYWDDCGGGMLNLAGSPTVRNCIFERNFAGNEFGLGGCGAGMSNGESSSPTLIACTFRNNSAYYGGGMDNALSSPTLDGCIFLGNDAGYGGGMYNANSSPTLAGCTFTQNSATGATPPKMAVNGGDGGGMYNTSSSPTLAACTFDHNSANGSGGGLYNTSSSPTLTNCPFSGNSATWGSGGGIADENSSSPNLTNCNFNGDSAGSIESRLSAIYDDSSSLSSLTNCTLSRIVYVDAASTASSPDGSSWSNAYADLQAGLAAAQSGDQIEVAQGTYKPTSTTDRTVSFQLKNGVSVLGGYAGLAGANPDDPNVTAYPTILSGDIGNAGDNSDNSYHVVISNAVNSTAVLDGFTIIGGNANGVGVQSDGGGMENNGGSPTIRNCTFEGNTADFLGGGMSDLQSSPTLSNCTFHANSAMLGGGMDNSFSSSPILNDCTFTDNTASASGSPDGDGGGGGMHNYLSSPILSNCTFKMNAGDSGGGISNQDSSPTISNCVFSENSAGGGGGIFNYASSPSLTNCTFTVNTAADEGGGMYDFLGSPTLINCTFDTNSVGDNNGCGGGIYNSASSLRLSNCIFAGNSVRLEGGGLYDENSGNLSPAVLKLSNCTFNNNSAKYGGGMYLHLSSTPKLNNCTFSRNSAICGGAIENSSSSSTLISCAFTGNFAYSGGGMYNSERSSPKLVNCELIGNSATGDGGGMFNHGGSSPKLINCTLSGNAASGRGGGLFDQASASVRISNSILWGKSASEASQIFGRGGTIKVSYSDVQEDRDGKGNINADPLFMRNPGPGPDGILGTPDDDFGDLRLQASSECIDAGNNPSIPRSVTTDLAGGPRIVGKRVDMGAYEAAARTVTTAVRVSLVASNVAIALQNNGTIPVSFGTVSLGHTGQSRTFQIMNAGNTALRLGEVTLPKGFELMGKLPKALAVGQTAQFQIGFVGKTPGRWSGNIQFATNDPLNKLFVIPVVAAVRQ